MSITKHKINSKNLNKFGTLKIIQLSDLHIQSVSSFYRLVAEKVNELNPDVIFITGDAIDQSEKIQVLDEFLSLLKADVRKFSIPGNWEHWGNINFDLLKSIYEKHNCQLLINETSKFRFNNEELLITGLDDATGGYPNINHALTNIEPQENHFLLAHSPQFIDTIYTNVSYNFLDEKKESDFRIQDYNFKTVFSGHTHGGQIAFFGFAPFRPRGSGKYVNGWYDVNGLKMYVNRGIGTSVIPARFMATPEISYFEYSII